MRPDLAEIAARATLYRPQGCEWTHVCRVGVLRFFYRLDGSSAAPARPEAAYREGIPDYVLSLAGLFEEAYRIFTEELGLADPLVSGRLAAEGVKHLDFVFDDIPKQRGIVPGRTVPAEACLREAGEEMRGRSLRIRLHRDLIENTATPVHELFHVFQYGYAPFTNAWFMEGLARWSQNLTHTRAPKEERLPSSPDEVDALLERAHDAEYFWRRLFSFCDGRTLVRSLFEAAAGEAEKMQRKPGFVWDRMRKRSPRNDAVLLRILVETVRRRCAERPEELETFLRACDAWDAQPPLPADVLTRFLRVLKKAAPEAVAESEEGVFECPVFDEKRCRLLLPELDLSRLDRFELDALNPLRRLDGKLILEGSRIEALNGFNDLRSVGGLRIRQSSRLRRILGFNALEKTAFLEIQKNPVLEVIAGFNLLFLRTEEMPGPLRITGNPALTSVRFLRGLKRTGSSLYLHHNALESLEGLEALETVGASLSLSSNRLTSLRPLSRLRKVGGMLGVAYNRLRTLAGLENLEQVKTVRWNGRKRTLAFHGNPALDDIRALAGVRSGDAEMIVLAGTRCPAVRPGWDSPFFRHRFRVYGENETLQRNKAELFDMRGGPIRVLFSKTGPGWVSALKSHSWLDARFLTFESPEAIIGYCYEHAVTTVLPIGIPAQLKATRFFIRLRDAGLKLLVTPENTLAVLKDKERFYGFMRERGWESCLPERFSPGGEMRFPLIVKPRIASGGKGSRIVFSAEELTPDDEALLAEEYIPGGEEYATNILFVNGEAVAHASYRKKAKTSVYILGQGESDQKHIVSEPCETPFLPFFETVLRAADFCGICCVDYKVRNGEPKIFEINARLGFTLAGMTEAFRRVLTRYEKYAAVFPKPRILFGENWKKATSRCDWMEAFHEKFDDADRLLQYACRHGIRVLFGNNYATQKRIGKQAGALRAGGMYFIVNPKETLAVLVDKRRFDDRMREAGLGGYTARLYASRDAAEYPCVVKPSSGGAGRGVRIAEGPEEIGEEDLLLTEYLPGTEEYATSVFYRDGALLHHRTYRKTAPHEPYVLQQERKVSVSACETPFPELFARIVRALHGDRGYCLCSFNYKIVDGKPKIFEINPRTGYTLAQHPEDFREFMACYLREAMREGSLYEK